MAKVLLAVPPMNAASVPPQLGVGYLASVLRAKGHAVDLVHCDAMGVGPRALIDRILRGRPDVVGFTVVTMAYEMVRALCRKLRERGFTGHLVLGGNHVTALPGLSLRQTGATAVVRNEGERTLPALVEALEAGRSLAVLPGVTWSDGGRIVENPAAPFIEDLDTIPFPAWDLMPPRKFPRAPHQLFSRRFPTAPFLISRGCPFSCTYCASQGMWARTWRTRGLDGVLEEIHLLVHKYGVRELHVEDDEFLANEDRVVEFCERLAAAEPDIIWSLPNGVRTNAVTDRAMKAMARSGCYEVGLGIDAAFPRQQERVRKVRHADDAARAIALVQKHGMEVRGYWILGFDTDSEEDVRRNIEYLLSLPADLAALGVSAPLPGSADFETFKQHVDLETIDWSQINYFKALDTPRIPKERLQALFREAVLRFYLRPKQLWAVARRAHPLQAPYVLRGLYRYLTGSFTTHAA